MVQRIYFLGLFLREASRNKDCNAVPELENHNLYLFFQVVQIKNQTVGWVVRPLENESGEVFGLVSYARGLAHGAALEPHVAYCKGQLRTGQDKVDFFCGPLQLAGSGLQELCLNFVCCA